MEVCGDSFALQTLVKRTGTRIREFKVLYSIIMIQIVLLRPTTCGQGTREQTSESSKVK